MNPRTLLAEEDETRQKKRSRGGEGDATRVDVGEGARIEPGVGESYWNVEGVDREVKIYKTGVVEDSDAVVHVHWCSEFTAQLHVECTCTAREFFLKKINRKSSC